MATVTLERGLFRRLWPMEEPVLRDHLLRLSRRARRARFAGGASDEFITAYAARAFSDDAVIVGWFADTVLRGVGELHPLSPRWRGVAEAAFSVEESWQGRGIGTDLMARVERAARNRAITRLVVLCLPDNAPMQRVARSRGARLEWEPDGVTARLATPGPTPWSLWREALEEGHGLLTILLEPRRGTGE